MVWRLLGCLLLLSGCAAPAAADFAGDYRIAGSNPDGSRYEGGLRVLADDPLRFVWDTGGGEVYGVAVARGDLSAAAYGPPGCGVALYELDDQGRLDGIWASDGLSGSGSERAVSPSSEPELGGSYTISGTNPDGSNYSGTLTIDLRGDRFEFTWNIPNSVSGVGLQRDRSVAVGYGGPDCGVALYRRSSSGDLDGEWVLPAPADARIATERAIRREP